jgi:NitT/TauT family transport system substrate-binding protein
VDTPGSTGGPASIRLSRRALGTGAAAAVAGIASAACTGGDDGGGADRVTALTGFGSFGRDSYFWVGREKGFFDEVGIDLAIEPGQGTALNIAEVVAGSADFCVGDMSGSLIVYSEGAAGAEEFVMVGAIHQLAPLSIMFRADAGIRSPADLEGRVIGDSPGSVGLLLFPAYAAVAGIDPDRVEFFQVDPPQLPGLLAAGEVDAINQFIFGLPTVERAVGASVDHLVYADLMPALLGNAIMTRRKLAADNPDLVRRFTTALLRSLEDALDNPAEAGEILNSHEPEVDAATAAGEVELMVPYVRQPGVPVGTIDPDQVGEAIALVESVGAIRPGIRPEDVIDFSLVPDADG